MHWRFYTPSAQDAERLVPFFSLRPNKTCDSGWLDFFIWAEYYHVRYCVADDKALLLVMKNGDSGICTPSDLSRGNAFLPEDGI